MSPEDRSAFFEEMSKKDDEYRPIKPYGSIQWKGTDVCMDISCECGFHSHIDGEFAYYFQCSKCKKCFAIGTYVKLMEMTGQQICHVISNSSTGFYTDKDGWMEDE